MRIAVCWGESSRLIDISVRHEHYVRGFRALGHDVVVVCQPCAAEGFKLPVVVTVSEEMRKPSFWRQLGVSVVLMVTWLSRSEELSAANAAGAKTIAIADSDGQVGVRVHAKHQLYRSVMQHSRWSDRVKAVRYFLMRYATSAATDSEQILASVLASDRILLNSQAAVANLERFLKSAGRTDLCSRLVVSPYPVDATFIENAVCRSKQVQLVAVGRWDSMQKNGSLLAATLRRYYNTGGLARSLIFGPGGRALFAGLCEDFKPAEYRGAAQPELIASAMQQSQVLLLTSRWESGPIVAFEALTQGCTIVSTSIPNMVELTCGGGFGRIAQANTPTGLAVALHDEFSAWQSGRRSPESIAAHWRPHFDAIRGARLMLEFVGLQHSNSCGAFESGGHQ